MRSIKIKTVYNIIEQLRYGWSDRMLGGGWREHPVNMLQGHRVLRTLKQICLLWKLFTTFSRKTIIIKKSSFRSDFLSLAYYFYYCFIIAYISGTNQIYQALNEAGLKIYRLGYK